MKIVVTAQGLTPDSPVDPRFGRAATFVVFDTETGAVTAVRNDEGVNASVGAGVRAAETVSRLGADTLITGYCGPKALRALQAAGIEVLVGASGTVSEAMDRLAAGELQRADADEAPGRWR